ncbi:hypothetical protein M426DRAFT_14342 [Hypoxylon sp. CI-4A]|nr:hypothetical protein M426DRAFT_14342 [Hypoxylon sp. CI-4A]
MSRYDDGYSRGRSNHHRDRLPEYTYAADAYPVSYEESRRLAKLGNPAIDEAPPLKQLTYGPNTPFYPPPPSNLQVPDPQSRPRSLPPPVEYHRRSSRGRRDRRHERYDYSDDSDSDSDRPHTPPDKARGFVDNAFTNTTAGLGIGVLGALVGGLAAREAVDATGKHHSSSSHHEDSDRKRNQLIGTVVGAAVGALGANAVEKRLEVHREKGKVKQEKWERKFRPDPDVVEKRELLTRPHSSSGDAYGWKQDWDPWDQHSRERERERERERDRDRDRARTRSRGLEREVDPDARSWKNVEEWLYDERND